MVAALALALACSSDPSSTYRQREVILKSEDVDRKVGEESAVDVRSQLGLIEDPLLAEYVNAVGQRLARHAPQRRFRYTFQIVDQEAPNAFALPGGFIYISRGLLVLTNSEDELANVLGHEIVHVAARHAAARQQMMHGALSWLQAGYLAGYERSQESEADRLGQGLAAVAGYNPEGMAVFLRELEHTERVMLGSSRLPSFFDTHPSTSRRVTEAVMRGRMTSWKPQPRIAATREEYLQRIAGLAIGSRASEGVFIGDRFLHADLDLAVRFPAGWETRNTHVAVGAFSKTRDAQIFLEHQGLGTDVEAAAAEYLQELADQKFEVDDTQTLSIGEHPAFRVRGSLRGQFGRIRAMFTFVQRDAAIYRFTAVTNSSFDRYQGTFLNVPRSMRALTPAERQQIRESRLQIAIARSGETLETLSRRTDNSWNLQQTAVMNGTSVDRPLQPGEPVKIAVLEDYEPEPVSDDPIPLS